MRSFSIFARYIGRKIQQNGSENYLMLFAIFVGVIAGLAALTLKYSVHMMSKVLLNERRFDLSNFLLLIYPFIGIALTILMKKYLLRDVNVSHGLSSILRSISKHKSYIEPHKMYSSLLGAMITVGFGGSAGLEAPLVSSGSAIGSNIGRWFRFDYKSVTTLLACGSAGAVAAVYNAPIAGIVFSLEVLLIDLSRSTLIPLLLAAISGAIISKLFKTDIMFKCDKVDPFNSSDILFFVFFAIVSAFVSLYFTKVYLFIQRRFKSIKNEYRRLLLGGLILGLLMFIFPPLFGEGFSTIKGTISGFYLDDMNNTLFRHYQDNVPVIIFFFGMLILLKVVASAATIYSGGIGGTFAPSLFTGAVTGFLYAYIINYVCENHLHINLHLSELNFALVGMGSMLTGVMHAPLTGVFLIAEITGGYHLIIPLLLTTTLAFIVIKFFTDSNIVTADLVEKGELITHDKDKAVLTFMSAKNLVETNFTTVHIDDTLGDLVRIIPKTQRDVFPVIEDNDYLVGMVHLEDVRTVMFKTELYHSMTVNDLVSLPPAYISLTESVENIMNKFIQTEANYLPVVEKGTFLGFISKINLLLHYREMLVELSSE